MVYGSILDKTVAVNHIKMHVSMLLSLDWVNELREQRGHDVCVGWADMSKQILL